MVAPYAQRTDLRGSPQERVTLVGNAMPRTSVWPLATNTATRAGRHVVGWQLPGECVGSRCWLRSPPPDLISVPYAGKGPGQKKVGLPFRATPGHGWAGFMNYAPNIKLVTGGRQGYESTGSDSLCRQERPTARKKFAVAPGLEQSCKERRSNPGVSGEPVESAQKLRFLLAVYDRSS